MQIWVLPPEPHLKRKQGVVAQARISRNYISSLYFLETGASWVLLAGLLGQFLASESLCLVKHSEWFLRNHTQDCPLPTNTHTHTHLQRPLRFVFHRVLTWGNYSSTAQPMESTQRQKERTDSTMSSAHHALLYPHCPCSHCKHKLTAAAGACDGSARGCVYR